MMKFSFYINSKADKTPLHCTIIAADRPQFLLQIIHGMGEHSGRYFPFMDRMAALGAACIIHDQRGHGKSLIDGKYGWCGVDGKRAVISDALTVSRAASLIYPELEKVVLGHSMGSLVARLLAAAHDDEISGLILTGSPSRRRISSLAAAWIYLWEVFAGDDFTPKRFNAFSDTIANRSFDKCEGDFSWISSDENVRKAFIADPACARPYTLEGFRTLFLLMRDTYRPTVWNIRNKSMPILFVSGADDPIARGRKSFNDSVNFMRDIGYADVRGIFHEGMRHEVLNDIGHEAVESEIVDFIYNIEKSRKSGNYPCNLHKFVV